MDSRVEGWEDRWMSYFDSSKLSSSEEAPMRVS